MKTEVRQHGAVRCHEYSPALLARDRFRKMVGSGLTTGSSTKVLNKPTTNHSKFTGKCRKPRCTGHHMHTVHKFKGTTKTKSMDPENELIRYSFGNSATAVLAYLADDSGYNDDYDYDGVVKENYDYRYHYDDDDHDNIHVGFEIGIAVEEHENDVDINEIGNEDNDDHHHDIELGIAALIASQEHVDIDEIDDDDHHHHNGVDIHVGFEFGIAAEDHENDYYDDDDNDDEDDDMSYCDVGLCWGHDDGDGDGDGDDGWYLVGGEMQ